MMNDSFYIRSLFSLILHNLKLLNTSPVLCVLCLPNIFNCGVSRCEIVNALFFYSLLVFLSHPMYVLITLLISVSLSRSLNVIRRLKVSISTSLVLHALKCFYLILKMIFCICSSFQHLFFFMFMV